MTVKSRHAEYEKFAPKWKRSRDVSSGQDAVHAAGTAYLPQLKDQDEISYKAYVMRAVFYNATWRTIDGLKGMLFRIAPEQELPPVLDDFLDDVDTKGTPLLSFAMDAVEETLKVGRMGILVDYPPVNTAKATQADVVAENIRPFMVKYTAEEIINWRTRRIKNRTVLSMLVLEESVAEPKDEFKDTNIPQWRVLDLDPAAGDRYRVRVIRVGADGIEYIHEGPFYPLMNNKPMEYIPFYFCSVAGNTVVCDDPPLVDLVDMNLSHYRTTADYEHGCHFTGLPTPWIAGYSPEKNAQGEVTQKLYIGSSHAWTFPDANAKCGYLEFAGTGLSALRDNLSGKETKMAVLGARMLEQQKKEVETAEAAAIHRGGEQSMLATTAQAISESLMAALRTFAQWAGSTPKDDGSDVVYNLNREFVPMGIEPQLLTAFVGALQAGSISQQTFFDNMQRREVIDRETTFEQEQGRIESDEPKLPKNMLGALLDPNKPGPPGPTKPAPSKPTKEKADEEQ